MLVSSAPSVNNIYSVQCSINRITEEVRESTNGKRMPQLPSRVHNLIPFYGLFFLLTVLHPGVVARSCREASLCCNGRDSSCVVQKAPLNTIIEDPINDKPCYCDHACLKLGDCCEDFKQFCGGTYILIEAKSIDVLQNNNFTMTCI